MEDFLAEKEDEVANFIDQTLQNKSAKKLRQLIELTYSPSYSGAFNYIIENDHIENEREMDQIVANVIIKRMKEGFIFIGPFIIILKLLPPQKVLKLFIVKFYKQHLLARSIDFHSRLLNIQLNTELLRKICKLGLFKMLID